MALWSPQRLAKLAGGVAVIRVGGATEVEVKEKKDPRRRCHACHEGGRRGGHPPGRGVALLRSATAVAKLKAGNEDQRTGIETVRRAVQSPTRQIALSAGEDGPVIVGKILEKSDYAFGFNAQTGEYGDMYKLGMIDPAKVVRTALQGAASVAGLLINTEAMVAELPKKAASAPAGPGMDF